MHSRIYWIDAPRAGRLAIMPRPHGREGLEDEIAHWRESRIDTVVSLLVQEEIVELGLDQEADLCSANGVEFISFPILDRGVPGSLRETRALVSLVCARLASAKAVAVHCRAGIGRSALVAACVLTFCGYDVSDAFTMIATSRRVTVPDTDDQRDWVKSFHAAEKGQTRL
jgi:protein-tyrosine phosphatase